MLNNFQMGIMNLLILTRSEYSYFAGGTALNFQLPRCSNDFDIFHDEQAACAKSFVTDIDLLRQHGYSIKILRSPEKNGIGEVSVSKEKESTQIQWATDSAYRFYPVEKDSQFGFKLHYHDLATNKLLALAGRAEIRDYYDVCEMIHTNKPVVAYVWAACAKDPGYTPLSLLDYMSLNSKYRTEDLVYINAQKKLSIIQCKNLFQSMLHEAREKFAYAPVDEQGCLYLRKDDLSIYFPNKEDFQNKSYIKHEARPFGAFPQIAPNEPESPKPQNRHRMR